MKPPLVKVKTMLDGEKVETVDQATELAIDGAVAELRDDAPADVETAENIHDSLARLDALKRAGKIGKIS